MITLFFSPLTVQKHQFCYDPCGQQSVNQNTYTIAVSKKILICIGSVWQAYKIFASSVMKNTQHWNTLFFTKMHRKNDILSTNVCQNSFLSSDINLSDQIGSKDTHIAICIGMGPATVPIQIPTFDIFEHWLAVTWK